MNSDPIRLRGMIALAMTANAITIIRTGALRTMLMKGW